METRLASRGSRLIAQILDGLIAVVIVCAGLLVAFLSGEIATGGVFFISAILLAMLYILLSDGFQNGQSYGKRAMESPSSTPPRSSRAATESLFCAT
ncbi:MAG: RDD family protein [Acidobacteriota bacterium]